ncbi:MAG: hypothetical protein NC335_00110 [Bacteroides sp.]|nr:hypothetical protein [Bacteroides sp.]
MCNVFKQIIPFVMSAVLVSCSGDYSLTLVDESEPYEYDGEIVVRSHWTSRGKEDVYIYDKVTGVQNDYLEIYDSDGRIKCQAGFASECIPSVANSVNYVYEGDVLRGFLYGFREDSNAMDIEEKLHDVYDTEAYLYVLHKFLRKHRDSMEQYFLRYDENGEIVEVYDTVSHRLLLAPEGYHIEAHVNRNSAFWDSDISGGLVLLDFIIRPVCKDLSSGYSIARYLGYRKQMIETYSGNAFLKRRELYGKDSNLLLSQEIFADKDGNITVEQINNQTGIRIIYTFAGRFLEKRETVSQYGTVLQRDTYSGMPKEKIMYSTEKYNYSKGLLEKAGTPSAVPYGEYLSYGFEEINSNMDAAIWDEWDCLLPRDRWPVLEFPVEDDILNII